MDSILMEDGTLSPELSMLIFFGASAICGYLLAVLAQASRRIPPGPWSWPLVGSINLLDEDFYLKLGELGKQYGEIFSINLGSRLTIVLNSSKMIREAFVKEGKTFAGRPRPWVMELMGVKEVINNSTYSDEWKTEKKLFLKALRSFGYGSSTLDGKLQFEVDNLVRKLEETKGDAVDMRQFLPNMMANVTFSILINESYECEDPELLSKLELIRKWQKGVAAANPLDLFPWLRFLPWPPLKRLRTVKEEITAMYGAHVREHKATFDENNLRDMVDVYIKEKGIDCNDDEIVGMFFSIVGDSIDSLSEAMVWMILAMAHSPAVQDKLFTEISDFIGTSKTISSANIASMPYAEACILETLRYASFIPVSEAHLAMEDSVLGGYDIPKGSVVLANIHAAHFETEAWEDPDDFRPERFIDEDDSIKRDPSFVPFSLGRRICPGEQLSMKAMYLLLVKLVQTFTIDFPDGEPGPGLKPQRVYGCRMASEFKVSLLPR